MNQVRFHSAPSLTPIPVLHTDDLGEPKSSDDATNERPTEKGDRSGSSDSDDSSWMTPSKLLTGLLIAIPLLMLLSALAKTTPNAASQIQFPPKQQGSPAVTQPWYAEPAPQIEVVQPTNGGVHINNNANPAEATATAAPTAQPVHVDLRDPHRLGKILAALLLVLLPLAFDYMRGWPDRSDGYEKPEYARPLFQYLVLALLLTLVLFLLDQNSHPVSITRIMDAGPTIVQGADSVVMVAEDALFGNGRTLVGVAIALLTAALVSTIGGPGATAEIEYAPALVQFGYGLGAGVLGLFLANAMG